MTHDSQSLDEEPEDTPAVLTSRDRDDRDPIDRLERLERNVAFLLKSRKRTLQGLLALVVASVGAVGGVLHYAADRIATSSERAGEQAADIRNLREENGHLREEIKELRERLLHLSGADHRSPPTSADLLPPDKFSLSSPSLLDDGPGGSRPHLPKLHRPHPCCGRIWHSALLEHTSPHTLGLKSGFAPFGEAQAARAIAVNKLILDIPYL